MKNNRIINKEVLEKAMPGDIIASGTFTDSGDTNMAGTGKEVRWVAVRGDIPDWAVYCESMYDELSWDTKRIATTGMKIPAGIMVNLFDEVSLYAREWYRG